METSSKDPFSFSFFKSLFQQHSEVVYLSLLIVFGWIIRIIIAVNTGGLVHPDEIYQSLEIAHDMKYGYGFIPWEFKIPATPDEDGAARSYLFPMLFYYIFELCEMLDIPYGINGTLRIVRIFSATYCTLLIPIVYYLSKELLPSQKSPYIFSLFAAFLVTVWFQFPYFGIRTLTNSFVTPIIFGALYLQLKVTNNTNKYSFFRIITSGFIIGFFLGLTCVIRMDSFVFFVPFFILYHKKNRKMMLQYLFIILGFIAMFFIQGMTDLFFYGTFLASPINWFTFNILENKSSNFGVQPFLYYFGKILVQPFYLIYFILVVLAICFRVQNIAYKFQGQIHDEWFFATLKLFLLVLIPLIIMSLIEHKEERFIFSIFPIIMLLFAATTKELQLLLSDLYCFIHERLLPILDKDRKPLQTEIKSLQICLLLVLSLFTVNVSFFSGYRVDWAFFHDVNKSLEWVGDQENSSGIIMFSNWFYTGGWTHIHKNITMKCYNDPEKDQSWRFLIDKYNYLVTPHYQYFFHEELKYQVNNSFRIIKTVDGRVDIWYLRV